MPNQQPCKGKRSGHRWSSIMRKCTMYSTGCWCVHCTSVGRQSSRSLSYVYFWARRGKNKSPFSLRTRGLRGRREEGRGQIPHSLSSSLAVARTVGGRLRRQSVPQDLAMRLLPLPLVIPCGHLLSRRRCLFWAPHFPHRCPQSPEKGRRRIGDEKRDGGDGWILSPPPRLEAVKAVGRSVKGQASAEPELPE